jgi:hypothetical protein
MKREQYTQQQNHSSFQPQSVTHQSSLEHNQFNQPTHHSSAIADQTRPNWFDQANQWVADKVQTAQTFALGGDAIVSDDILPALQSGKHANSTLNSQTQPKQALVGIIDSGFGANDHGTQMLDTIRDVNPEASVVLKDSAGKGSWAESLTEFVDTAKASRQTGAVANLSFDLTEVRPDGTVTTRSQLTAEEQAALNYARDNNVLVVASAGNEGGAMSALGQASQQFENVIAVGAAEGNNRADYSSYGPGLDLVANGNKNGKEGTSFAAAEVTAAISEIWEANPHLTSSQVTQTLQATATDLNTAGWDAETGFGKLNLDSARSLAQQITPDSQVFSGGALLQQTQGSFDGTTWQSQDGSIASERSNQAREVLKYRPGAPQKSDQVRQWQQRMKDLGYKIDVDGIYGKQSAGVARQFQKDKGLAVDGVVGPQTWAKAFGNDSRQTPTARNRPGNTVSYNRSKAVQYARQYAVNPNPKYATFGADCTNFASQVLIAGGAVNQATAAEKPGFYNPAKLDWFRASTYNPNKIRLKPDFIGAARLPTRLANDNIASIKSIDPGNKQAAETAIRSFLKPGDLIGYQEDNDPETDHVNVFLGFEGGKPIAANHTDNKIGAVPLDKVQKLVHIRG